MWGIVPAAGRGSRIQPLAFSKELLPVGSRRDNGAERPCAVSEYLLERLALGGADKLCFVIGPGKSDILEYYGESYGTIATAYVVQPFPAGLCDAIFRAAPFVASAEPVLMSSTFAQPNGLAFGDGEKVLFVVDSERDTISALPVDDAGTLGAPRTLIDDGRGFDGIRIDAAGRLWAATRDGVSCFDAEGIELLRIAVPEPVSNLEFGGRQRNTLYVTATTSVYSLRTSVRGRHL